MQASRNSRHDGSDAANLTASDRYKLVKRYLESQGYEEAAHTRVPIKFPAHKNPVINQDVPERIVETDYHAALRLILEGKAELVTK